MNTQLIQQISDLIDEKLQDMKEDMRGMKENMQGMKEDMQVFYKGKNQKPHVLYHVAIFFTSMGENRKVQEPCCDSCTLCSPTYYAILSSMVFLILSTSSKR